MKFFTRELYAAMQGEGPNVGDVGCNPDGTGEYFAVRWQRVCDEYQQHLARIRSRLPPGMRTFAETTLHDGVVRAVARPGPTELILDVDKWSGTLGRVCRHRIRFTGVREAEGIDRLVGDDWLYEEVDLNEARGFDFRVIFARTEVRIIADELEVRERPVDIGRRP